MYSWLDDLIAIFWKSPEFRTTPNGDQFLCGDRPFSYADNDVLVINRFGGSDELVILEEERDGVI